MIVYATVCLFPGSDHDNHFRSLSLAPYVVSLSALFSHRFSISKLLHAQHGKEVQILPLLSSVFARKFGHGPCIAEGLE
jgi:hypothetical protein